MVVCDRRSFWRSCAFAFVGLFGVISTADAACTMARSDYGYRPNQNDTLDMEMTCDIKGTGHWRNTPGSGYEMTGISVVSNPHNGTLKAWGNRSWRYTPKGTGSDSFSIKQCATLNRDASGCSTLNYKITIQ